MYNANCKYNKTVSRPAFMFTNIQSELFQLGSVMAIHIVSALHWSNVCLMINWSNGNEES